IWPQYFSVHEIMAFNRRTSPPQRRSGPRSSHWAQTTFASTSRRTFTIISTAKITLDYNSSCSTRKKSGSFRLFPTYASSGRLRSEVRVSSACYSPVDNQPQKRNSGQRGRCPRELRAGKILLRAVSLHVGLGGFISMV